MKLAVKKDLEKLKAGDVCCIFITEEQIANCIDILPEQIKTAVSSINIDSFKGKLGECFFVPLKKAPSLIICGLGKTIELRPELFRRAGASLTSFCISKNIRNINCLPPKPGTFVEAETIQLSAEGIALSNYKFDKFKTTDDKKTKLIESCTFISMDPLSIQIIHTLQIIYNNTVLCRDLVNDSSYNSTPENIANIAKKLVTDKNAKCQIFGKKQLEDMKMGLLLAVNQGSARSAQMVVLTYKGDPSNKESIALVGKGLTYDSGGMNLKGSGHIEAMRMDMAGAATVMYAFKAAVELKLKKNIYAVLPLTENMLSNNSYRAGDVYTAYNGLTVEIGNTDAEGRLILADAIAYTVDKLKPSYIIDLATLTGACVITFGELVAGLISTDITLENRLRKASEKTGEKLWPLPLYKEYEENMKSDIADINNTASEKNSGTIHGAAFLKNFVNKVPWAHIDIAGTAWHTKDRGYRPKNATAFGLRLIISLLSNWDEK